jgi:hypothetical protein
MWWVCRRSVEKRGMIRTGDYTFFYEKLLANLQMGQRRHSRSREL